MPKINIKFSSRMKKFLFIGIVLFALLFVVFRFNRNSEFRIAKKAYNEMDYVRAAELFDAMGTYSDSHLYAAYCRAMNTFMQGDFEAALELFESLDNFQKAPKYVLYCKGMISYQNSQYWEGASFFEQCGESLLGHTAFLDNEDKAKMCYYTSGWILETSGDYSRAIICYRLADDYDDAKTRLKECEEALASGGNTSAYGDY